MKNIMFLLLWVSMLFPGCKDAANPAPESVTEVQQPALVRAEKLSEVQAAALQLLATSQGYGQFAQEFQHDVEVYRLIYRTTYQDRSVEASGLMCVPKGKTTATPILSAQHGTIFKASDAPSAFNGGFTGFELFASAGYLTVIPDYLGFGASEQIFHPYYVQKYSGLAVVDMIKAAKEFAAKQDMQLNEKLFLAGYSEGGYVTLAAQKEIETNPKHGLKITAVGAGAGGYDLMDMLAMVESGSNYGNPAYLAYVLMAYNNSFSWNRPLTDFFQEPYASRMPQLFDKQHSGSQINQQLTSDPAKLFQPAFLQALRGNGEQQVKQALQQNSFNTFVPKSPTRLYHGTSDSVVPFQNSQKTYNRFKAAGAQNVTFIPIEGGNHGSSLGPMLLDLIPWFKSM